MENIAPFEKKLWLSSPTMHGDEQKFVTEAFDTNWIAPLGENVNKLPTPLYFLGRRKQAQKLILLFHQVHLIQLLFQ